ncbi:septal ring lytic transglycosylase RlpA family protein [Rhodocytophaga rosea]|uniref:Probable endolytic peptidoglycan transglycosylase RlpA n=1 Tax=Rhodocytophaga rosea TaxID=2704465 RepID=A0A6C0GQ66_9BACT|nr:septal ring lytic transglycosylase RlpA family protein [Rhodocytophaga rosea]QHT70201.1 septal ring lytic transglycosylase RlpA family protein [Rhodocytophaga rosea]
MKLSQNISFICVCLIIISFSCKSVSTSKLSSQTGIASFYSNKFNGNKTASGEIYRKSRLTAAHKTLPFGTQVKVTNLTNNLSVTVRINDRGPFAKGRIIDLSRGAAKKLGMIKQGVARVKIEYKKAAS